VHARGEEYCQNPSPLRVLQGRFGSYVVAPGTTAERMAIEGKSTLIPSSQHGKLLRDYEPFLLRGFEGEH